MHGPLHFTVTLLIVLWMATWQYLLHAVIEVSFFVLFIKTSITMFIDLCELFNSDDSNQLEHFSQVRINIFGIGTGSQARYNCGTLLRHHPPTPSLGYYQQKKIETVNARIGEFYFSLLNGKWNKQSYHAFQG